MEALTAGFFSPFPHGTGSLSVALTYLALEGGPPSFPQGFSCPVVLGVNPQPPRLASHTGLSPSMAGRSRTLLVTSRTQSRRSYPPPELPHNPLSATHTSFPLKTFRLVPFRSPLLRESLLISPPPGTKMVQFPGFAFAPYSFQERIPAHDGRGVAPFGYLWLTACLRLPTAFRSSPRPSSPQRAKASTVCSSLS